MRNMHFAFILVVLVGASQGFHTEWNSFKLTHGRKYESPKEESFRFGVFRENMKMIAEHNAKYEQGLETYYLGMNQFGDMTQEEYEQETSCLDLPSDLNFTDSEKFVAPSGFKRPESVDWRDKGAVNEIRNQKKCGSCWAFASIECLESIYFIRSSKMLTLSTQQLVDCAKPYANKGCHGGYMNKAYRYIKDYGSMLESDYPYIAAEGKCQYDADKVVLLVKGSKFIVGEDALQDAIASAGPISVGVDARDWKFYQGGIYAQKQPFRKLTHGVVAVGYGTEADKEYYILRNSYGPGWGEKGYIRVARNRDNQFGIAKAAVLPLL